MRARIIGGALIGIPALAAFFAGGIWFLLLVLIFGAIAQIEFVHLVARRGHRAFGGLMLLWLALFVLDRVAPEWNLLNPGMALMLVLTLVWALIRYRQGTPNAFTGFAMTVAGAFYIGWSGSHLISLRNLPDGLFWMLIVLPSVWAADTMAYFFGRAFGRVKMMPDVSPGKTWEGYFGAVISTPLIVAGLAALYQQLGAGPAVTAVQGFVIGVLIAAISPIGDFGISMLKRYVDVKDSSRLIPGHGGFLDRIDATLVAILIGYYYLTLLVL